MKSIRELLTGRVPLTLPLTATALEGALAMGEAHVGCVLVTNGETPAGVFTERDLMMRIVVKGLDPAKVKIGDVMTSELFTVHPDRRINEVAREMQSRHIRHLPVIEDDHVLGVLSLRDLLREHLEVKRHEVQALTAYIQGEADAPPPPED